MGVVHVLWSLDGLVGRKLRTGDLVLVVGRTEQGDLLGVVQPSGEVLIHRLEDRVKG